MADAAVSQPRYLHSPAASAVAVTPDNSNDLAATCRALYIGVSGDVEVILTDDSASVIFKSVPIGILPVRAKRVRAAGTTATNILALS